MSLAGALEPVEQVIDPQLLAQPRYEGAVPDSGTSYGDLAVNVSQPTLKVEIPGTTATTDAKDEEMGDLFGDDDAENIRRDSSASPAPSAPASDGLSAAEQQHRKDLEYEEDEGGEETVLELKHAALSIPNIPAPRSSDGSNWVIRMPNFVKLDPKPFHPDTYVGPEQVDEESHQADTLREKSMSIKLEVENTIRWRWEKDENGQNRRHANSRVIRWSDGSLSLLLGKELFDINQTFDTSATAPRQPLSGSQSQSQSQSQSSSTVGKTNGLTYLVAQHKRPGILQVEAPISGYMTLRPTGMQSETHRMLVRAVGQKHNKVARLRMAPDPTTDPERAVQELMKQQNRKSKTRKEDDGLGSRRRRNVPASRRRISDQVWSDEDEHEAAFEGSDDDEDEIFGGRKTKVAATDPAGKKGSGEYQTDDFVVADSSEEDNGSDAGPRKKRRRSGTEVDAAGEADALDELDEKIARQREERRRDRKSGPQDAGDAEPADEDNRRDEEMDIESEEEDDDEEDFKVRRAGSGPRKKRTITIDEDEDEE